MNATKRRYSIAGVMLAALLLPMLGGCSNQTPAQKLYLARQSYIGTEQAITALIRAKVIEAGPTLDAIEAVRNEARDALAAADSAVGTMGFDFVMARVQSALGRLAQFYLDHKAQPAEPGATRWTPPRSLPASPRWQPSPPALAKRSQSSILARTSPPRIRKLCA